MLLHFQLLSPFLLFLPFSPLDLIVDVHHEVERALPVLLQLHVDHRVPQLLQHERPVHCLQRVLLLLLVQVVDKMGIAVHLHHILVVHDDVNVEELQRHFRPHALLVEQSEGVGYLDLARHLLLRASVLEVIGAAQFLVGQGRVLVVQSFPGLLAGLNDIRVNLFPVDFNRLVDGPEFIGFNFHVVHPLEIGDPEGREPEVSPIQIRRHLEAECLQIWGFLDCRIDVRLVIFLVGFGQFEAVDQVYQRGLDDVGVALALVPQNIYSSPADFSRVNPQPGQISKEVVAVVIVGGPVLGEDLIEAADDVGRFVVVPVVDVDGRDTVEHIPQIGRCEELGRQIHQIVNEVAIAAGQLCTVEVFELDHHVAAQANVHDCVRL